MGESEDWLEDKTLAERSDPNRSDWLANIWHYATLIEERVADLEKRLQRLEQDDIHFSPRFRPPLDED